MSGFVGKAILMSLLPFYRVDFPMDAFPFELTHVTYDRGREVSRSQVRREDACHSALRDLLQKNAQGWRYDMNTYAPAHLFVSSKMRINKREADVVVNYEHEDGGWIQISRSISDSCLVTSLQPCDRAVDCAD